MGRIGTFYASLPAWVQGALVAIEGGIIGFVLQWASDPDPVCFSRACLRHFGGAAAGAIVVSLRNWLKQSPLSRDVWTPEQRDAVKTAKDVMPPVPPATQASTPTQEKEKKP